MPQDANAAPAGRPDARESAPPNAESVIALDNISLFYNTGNQDILALDRVSLNIREGEFLCILGPSGCGKSTLLKIVAGFLHPSEGKAAIRGEAITGPDWHRGVVFQQSALYPWLSVEDNIQFGMKMRHIPVKERQETAAFYLEKMGLRDFRRNKPYELSGGMKQRVSIARVLVNNPVIMLMDEPFGALDALTRQQMQKLIRQIWRETRKTILFITHDVDEALDLATRIVVMSQRPGRILREISSDLAAKIENDATGKARFSNEFKEMREQVLDLINSVQNGQ